MKLSEILEPEMAKGRFWSHSKQLISGCTKISPGCLHCWSESMDRRFYGKGFDGTIIEHPKRLADILPKSNRRKPRVYTYWNDIFHEATSISLKNSLFEIISQSSDYHIICTKRPYEALKYLACCNPLKNVIIMVTMESQEQLLNRRAAALTLHEQGHNVGILVEPMLTPVFISQLGFNPCWIIAGFENGKGARSVSIKYASSLIFQAELYGIPFFWKSGEIFGQTYRECPDMEI